MTQNSQHTLLLNSDSIAARLDSIPQNTAIIQEARILPVTQGLQSSTATRCS